MSDLIFNIALGRVAELYNRVDLSDPANAVFVIAVFDASDTDAAVRDVETLAAIEALGSTAEVTNTNYARKILDDTDIVAFAADHTNDRVDLDVPDQTWTAVVAGDAWTDLCFAYDSDSTGGADTAITPCSWHDFAVTPNGGDITAQINAAGFYRATE